jgi:hypothetical protein
MVQEKIDSNDFKIMVSMISDKHLISLANLMVPHDHRVI